ncbi:MAG: MATE family efflux transporter [bacterium]
MKEKSPLKSILQTSLPAVFDLSSQTLMWTVEAILIGQISAAAFGGVGMAIQVIVVCMAVLLTFIVGASLIITRHLGAENRWEANHVLGQTMIIGVILALLLTVLWYFGAPQILNLIRDESGEAKAAGITYLKTIAMFGPFIIINFIAVGVVRGSGATIHSMMINVGLNALNVCLAPILIFGLFGLPRLEVKGAALAAGISHTLGFIVTMLLLRSKKSVLFLSFRELTTPNWQTFKKLFNAGLPTTIEQLVWSFGLLVVSTYAAVISISVLAAHQVFLRIQSILSMVYMGFGLGAMTLMGKNLGAEQRKLAERTAEMAGWVVFFFVIVISVCMIFFSRSIITIFTDDPQVLRTGAVVIKLFALVQIPKAVDGVLMGNLRGAGDLKWLMWITIVSVIIFEISMNWLIAFVFNLSLWGLWLMHTADETIRLVLNYWHFRGGKWKFIDM